VKHATADKNMIGDVMQFIHFPVWNFDLRLPEEENKGNTSLETRRSKGCEHFAEHVFIDPIQVRQT